MLIKTILAGTFIFQGCTADGACWPTFITKRDVRVAVVETLEDKHGVCLCDGPSPLIMVRPGDEYPLHLLIAHELGHDNGVTRHADGSVWIRKEVK